tara:strand:+ start:42 stop:866 length:825 start_codon:yes stop_codon:yes gene_type:complete
MSIQQIVQEQAEIEKQKIRDEENKNRETSMMGMPPPDDPSITLNEQGVDKGLVEAKKQKTESERNLKILSNSKINFNFIESLEGKSLTGYVPDPTGSNSGVTIATGFDLGQRDVNDLKGLPKNLIDKFTKYVGLTGFEAEEQLKRFPLKITEKESKLITKKAKEDTIIKLYNQWEKATGTNFNNLNMGIQTSMASVAFQYGDLPTKTPIFWNAATRGQWDAVLNELRNFGDRYPTRRNKEADYLQKFLDPILDKMGRSEGAAVEQAFAIKNNTN